MTANPPPYGPTPNTSSATLSRLTAITNTASCDVTQLYLPTAASVPKLLHSAVLLSCRHFHTCTTDPNLLPSAFVGSLKAGKPGSFYSFLYFSLPISPFLILHPCQMSTLASMHEGCSGLPRSYQGRQCTYNVTLRRVRVTNVAVEKQYYTLRVCVCTLALVTRNVMCTCRITLLYAACHCLPYFSTLSHKRHDFREGTVLNVKCVF